MFIRKLIQVTSAMKEVAAREGLDVNFQVDAYQAAEGPRAIVTVAIGLRPLVCLECGNPSSAPFEDWHNAPGISGVRYVCPECYERLLTHQLRGCDESDSVRGVLE